MKQAPLEFPNFDHDLCVLRQTAMNPGKVDATSEPELRAYLKALRTLNTELLDGLDRFQRGVGSGDKIQQRNGRPRPRRNCREVAGYSAAGSGSGSAIRL
ncbi:MAG TPA: hypothetical protein VLY24_05820 [Bryobacteraceae bacterium]|nr:hypothetical protein [Bryobacteraceae bacterium]